MLFEELDKIKRNSIMSIIVLMLIGNIMLLTPEAYVSTMITALGFVLLVFAVVSIFDYIASKKALIHFIRLALGLFLGLIGVIVIAFDLDTLKILSWFFGIVSIISGVYGIYHAMTFAKRSGRRGWWILIPLSVALIAVGDFIFFNPWADSARALMQVAGGTLMFSAFVSAVQLIYIWPKKDG